MAPTIRIRNLDRYQHYKQRNPPWVKLHQQILDDYEFTGLKDPVKWLAVGLLLLASRLDNEIPGDPLWIKGKLSMSTTPDLQALEAIGFIECLQDASNPLATCPTTSPTVLAPCKQNGVSETETETEAETETDGHRNDDRVSVPDSTLTPEPIPTPDTDDTIPLSTWTGSGFEHFWAGYPRKVAKQAAARAFKKLYPRSGRREVVSARLAAIMDLLDQRLEEWDDEDRPDDKIPHPATWLNSEAFE